MRVIVAGAGKLGRRVAEVIKEKNTVVVVERNEARAKYIKELLDVQVVTGDADDPSVLLEAGIDRADVLVAATGEDEDNLVACVLAKFEFKVRKVIGAVRNPKNQWLYNRSWGVDVALDSAQIVARVIEEEATLRDLVTLLKLREGQVSVTEITVSQESKIAGKLVKDIELPEQCVAAAVLRGTEILVPSGDLRIEPGDEMLFIAHPDAESRLPALVR
jgi:trk system potassium uptake protein TrkA